MMIKNISGKIQKRSCRRTLSSSERIVRSKSIYPASSLEVDERSEMHFHLRDCSRLVRAREGGVSSAARVLICGLGLLWAFLFPMGSAIAQQASTSVAPLFSTNSKYVQGVGPGYWPTAGTGLSLSIAAGTAMCGSPPVVVTYAGGSLVMTASQTNYVFLDPSLNCTPSFNSTGFTFGQIPLAKVTTSASVITAITDSRTWFVPQPVGTDSAGRATLNGGLNSTVTDFTSQNITTFGNSQYLPYFFQHTLIQPTPYPWNNLQGLGVGSLSLGGGFNVNQNGQSNKTAYIALSAFETGYTAGEHIPFQVDLRKYARLGDAAGSSTLVQCWGGHSANGDEGCENHSNNLYPGTVEYAGTVSGSPGTGATTITITPTAGTSTQGEGGWLLDTNAGRAITGGTTTAISGTPPTVTMNNAVASNVIGTLGTAVTPGATQTSISVTVTPTFTVGTIANITTSTLVCVADAGEQECVKPSAVGGSTFTATFRKPHIAAAVISVGVTKNAPPTTIVTVNVKTACTATWDYFVFANVN